MNITCMYCKKPLRREAETMREPIPGTAYLKYRRVPNPRAKMPRVSVSMGAIDPEGLFCTMRCAARFGVDCARSMVQP